jgi:hypothetical protein
MSKDNLHTQSIPQDVVNEALRKFTEGYDILHPYLLALTTEERGSILKMGDKSVALVEKTVELAETNPQFCPPFFHLEDLKIDLADAVNLRVIRNRLQQLTREVDDTMMIAGSEAFTQTLSFYNVVKQAARDKIPGAQPLFDELKKRFIIGRPRKTTDTEQ